MTSIFLRLRDRVSIKRRLHILCFIVLCCTPWGTLTASEHQNFAYLYTIVNQNIQTPSLDYKIVRLSHQKAELFYRPFNIKNTKHKKSNYLSLSFIVFLILYYIICWYFLGRDPRRNTIIPIYKPPAGVSPAMMHYIAHKGFKSVEEAFVAALIHLSILGYVKIHESAFIYKFEKLKDPDKNLSIEERAIMQSFFKDGYMVQLDNYREFVPTQKKMCDLVKKKLSHSIFSRNLKCVVLGIMFTLIYIYYLIALVGPNFIIHLGATCIGIAVGFKCVSYIIKKINRGRYGDTSQYFIAFFTALLYLPIGYFTVGFVIGTMMYLGFINTLSIVAIMCLHFLFAELVKKPTVAGQKLIEKIIGFRLYLSIADKEKIEGFKTPRLTPELFESYLPYAISLGLENKWTNSLITQIKELTEIEREFRAKYRRHE